MLGTTYTDLRRGTVLVNALLLREITLREFAEAVDFLEAEAAQVLATVLGLSGEESAWQFRARQICLRAAARKRNLN